MNSIQPVHVVGLYPGSFTPPPHCIDILDRAKVLIGNKRLLEAYGKSIATRVERLLTITRPLEAVLREIESELPADGVVLLTDGDPLSCSLGQHLLKSLGPERLIFHPNVTTLQLAAARLKFSWQEAISVSLHGLADYFQLFSALTRAEHVAVFTDEENTPQTIAKALLERGTDGLFMTVIENLGTEQENVSQLTLEEVWDKSFMPLNLVVIERHYPPEISPCLGTPDHYFFHEKNIITQQSVRATGLALLAVTPEDLIWDLGAGCGAVAIEAAHLAFMGRAIAVERQGNRTAMIRENIRRMGAWTVDAVHGEMPGCLVELPDPDRIFISGGLGKDNFVLEEICHRLKSKGRLVMQCVLLDTLSQAQKYLESLGWNLGATQLSTSSTNRLAGNMRLEAHTPVFLLWAEKP